MTPQKAIEILERLQEPEPWEPQITSETWEALQMGIDAVEKQIPKKLGYTVLKYLVNGEEVSIKHPECPECRKTKSLWDAAVPVDHAYCHRCGQRIDRGGDT